MRDAGISLPDFSSADCPLHARATRLQVLSAAGAPLQVLSLGRTLRSLCSDGDYVWVSDMGDASDLARMPPRLHVLKVNMPSH